MSGGVAAAAAGMVPSTVSGPIVTAELSGLHRSVPGMVLSTCDGEVKGTTGGKKRLSSCSQVTCGVKMTLIGRTAPSASVATAFTSLQHYFKMTVPHHSFGGDVL